MSLMTTPFEPGVYDVELGDSWDVNGAGAVNTNTSFLALQYNFKPASIDRERPGRLTVDTNGTLTLQYAVQDAASNAQPVMFQGNMQQHPPTTDKGLVECILIFDEPTGRFRLERLAASAKGLRQQRRNAGTQPPPLPSLADLQKRARRVGKNAKRGRGGRTALPKRASSLLEDTDEAKRQRLEALGLATSDDDDDDRDDGSAFEDGATQ